jgi:hypothetical protein
MFVAGQPGPYTKPCESSVQPMHYFPKIRLNILLPSTPSSHKLSLFLTFSELNVSFVISPQRDSCNVHIIPFDLLT